MRSCFIYDMTWTYTSKEVNVKYMKFLLKMSFFSHDVCTRFPGTVIHLSQGLEHSHYLS